jgi:hypothetical protein
MEHGTVVIPGGGAVPGVFGILLVIFIAFIVLVATVIKVFCFCRIFSKAGYSWAFGLIVLVPFSEIIVPLMLALMDWPICKELRGFKKG